MIILKLIGIAILCLWGIGIVFAIILSFFLFPAALRGRREHIQREKMAKENIDDSQTSKEA